MIFFLSKFDINARVFFFPLEVKENNIFVGLSMRRILQNERREEENYSKLALDFYLV